MPRRSRIVLVAALATVLGTSLTAPAATFAATPTVVFLPIEPWALSDTGVVAGGKRDATGQGGYDPNYYRWAKGETATLANPAGALRANQSSDHGTFALSNGRVIGRFVRPGATLLDPATYERWVWPNATSPATRLASDPGEGLVNVDDLGRTLFLKREDTADARLTSLQYVRSDGLTSEAMVGGAYKANAPDGSFFLCANGLTGGPQGCKWYGAAPGSGGVSFSYPGSNVGWSHVGSNGFVLGLANDGGTLSFIVLEMSASGVKASARVPMPPVGDGTTVSGFGINGGGRIVAKFGSYGGVNSLWSHRPNESWRDLTPLLGGQGAGTGPANEMTVNGWGDIAVPLVGSPAGSGAPLGALITERVALTGQVAPVGTSPGGRERAAARASAPKVVTLSNGTSTMTAPVAARTGAFTLSVPVGSWQLQAPAGSCLVTAGGCVTSGELSAASTATKLALAKLQVPAVGSFVTRAGAKLKPVRGRVALVVRCNAAKPCAQTVTLKLGRVVAGKVTVPVKAGKTATASVPLSAAAKLLLTTRGVAATATLVATSPGRPKATTTLPLVVRS